MFLVNVPVLSKHKVFNLELYIVFDGYVPDIPYFLNLLKQKLYAKLNNIGKGAGKL